MNDFKTRLVKFAREWYDYGQNKFEEMCGIPRGTINNIKDGGGISTNTLTKIYLKCPELNLRWLLTGEGEAVQSGDPEVDEAKDIIYNLTLENARLKKRIAELEGKKEAV